jgi:hypothetical protein
MTASKANLFGLTVLAAGLLALAGCPPSQPLHPEERGTFLAAKNKLYDQNSEFDLRWNVVYPERSTQFNPSINVSNQELAFNRCTNCHECGFKPAFDYDNYGKPGWKPKYKGQQWQTIVERMNQKDGSMLNEQVANRIFMFLKDASLGKYDETADPKGALVVEVDPEQAKAGPEPGAADGGEGKTPEASPSPAAPPAGSGG